MMAPMTRAARALALLRWVANAAVTPWAFAFWAWRLAGSVGRRGAVAWLARADPTEVVKAAFGWPIVGLIALWSLGIPWLRQQLAVRRWGPMRRVDSDEAPLGRRSETRPESEP